jgi:hypothetical protein
MFAAQKSFCLCFFPPSQVVTKMGKFGKTSPKFPIVDYFADARDTLDDYLARLRPDFTLKTRTFQNFSRGRKIFVLFTLSALPGQVRSGYV